MPIRVEQFRTKPAISYNFLHMQECYIRIAATEEENPKTEIRAVFIPYGYEPDTGKKVFNPSGRIELIEEDFFRLAYSKFETGEDPRLLQAFMAMEGAMVSLLGLKLPKVVGTVEQVI